MVSCCHHQSTPSDPQIQLASPEKHGTAVPTRRAGTPSRGHSWQGTVQRQQPSLPALAVAEVPQDMVRRRQPCCPRRCRQARDRGSEGGATDLSFIADCSVAEAHESVKPRSVSAVPDISDGRAREKLSDQLHPGAFSPGRLSVRWVVDMGWGTFGTSGTSVLACPRVG